MFRSVQMFPRPFLSVGQSIVILPVHWERILLPSYADQRFPTSLALLPANKLSDLSITPFKTAHSWGTAAVWVCS